MATPAKIGYIRYVTFSATTRKNVIANFLRCRLASNFKVLEAFPVADRAEAVWGFIMIFLLILN
ncbi:hypothetical protein TKWG_00065 [Advenella kashmirensis WT001]|uniref:Uncharacterized protein n=1 Tax=Advenella kashmirensis (strain DSM 17095 / LMG 22695 / WT001) TaxID=1036672 RepID=I3U6V9_ADVKW|nr:hypothetical protein TKWG_00065 [Advenella kashmirensis WT001]